MIQVVFDFKNKILFTIQLLIKKVTKKSLSLDKFDMVNNNILVYFNNQDTNELYIRSIEWVFLNKKILRNFNNKEAAKIGCMYAKYVFIRRKNEK